MAAPFFHEQDYESLVRFLGKSEIPPKFAKEYIIRLKMYHMDGNSGPLGTLGLIDLLRFCGFHPAYIEVEKVVETDWSKVPVNSRVEARFGGCWMPGVFLGFGQWSQPLVRLDDDPHVKECRKDMVRPFSPELPPIEPESPPLKLPTEQPPTAQPTQTADVAPPADPTAWADVKPGSKVWVDLGDDMPDGEFVELASNGQVVVSVKGEQHTVDASNVTPAA